MDIYIYMDGQSDDKSISETKESSSKMCSSGKIMLVKE